MSLDNRAILVIQFALSLVAWSAVMIALVRPALARLDDQRALRWLMAPQMLRHVGMSLLAAGIAGPGLSRDFAVGVATGDVITAVLAIAAFIALGRPGRLGLGLAAAATLVGFADLVTNLVRGLQTRAADHLESAWPIVAFLVPLMVVFHVAAATRLVKVAGSRARVLS